MPRKTDKYPRQIVVGLTLTQAVALTKHAAKLKVSNAEVVRRLIDDLSKPVPLQVAAKASFDLELIEPPRQCKIVNLTAEGLEVPLLRRHDAPAERPAAPKQVALKQASEPGDDGSNHWGG